MKVLLLVGFILSILQSTLLSKYINFNCVIWDPLSIYIILASFYSRVKNIYTLAFFVGILQDILGQTILFNVFSKLFTVYIISFLKEKFFLSSFFSKTIIIVSLSLLDLALKQVYYILKTGNFYICFGFVIYISLNFLIFYLFYLFAENKLVKENDKQV